MSQRKSVTMFAETSDSALVPTGNRSAHFAALVEADSVRTGELAGTPPHVTRKTAAETWSISLSAALSEHLDRRRGSVPRADYLLWLLRLGKGAVVGAPVEAPIPAAFAKVDGKLCCSNCGSVFLPAPRSTTEWKRGSPYELDGALRRLKDPEPALTPIHLMLTFKVGVVSDLLSKLGVGRRMLLLVGVGPVAAAGPRRVGTVVAPESIGRRLIVPLSQYDAADVKHQIGVLTERLEGVFTCVTSACDGPEVERWANERDSGTIYPGTAVLMMRIERLA